MAEPITRTVTETWLPVAGPRACRCGHPHYGRISHPQQAPQWHICEDETCPCDRLRAADQPEDNRVTRIETITAVLLDHSFDHDLGECMCGHRAVGVDLAVHVAQQVDQALRGGL